LKVVVRIRPLNNNEDLDGYQSVVKAVDNYSINVQKDKMYRYDYVFDHHANQHVIFDTCVKSILEKFLGGYNCTIFAYGHTNSGKSYTIGTSYDDEF